MANTATSLKLRPEIKDRVNAAAAALGKSPHAYMVDALEAQLTRDELAEQFYRDALAAVEEAERTNTGYAGEDVHAYFRARVRGENPERPEPRPWRS